MKIKISEAVFNDYVERLSTDPLAFPKAWPGQVGIVEVDEDMAHLVQLDAEKMVKVSKPKMAMAYRSLADQVAKHREMMETMNSIVVEREEDVSQRNSGGVIQLARANIIVLNQVRTEMDEESIDELAEDIEVNGLINPVTVRPAEDGTYYLVAGERRMRACTLAGVPIMARVIQADEEGARRVQLAENIHREELSMKDKARAVGELYDQLGNMQEVADLVKKSRGWVSKLVALNKGMGYWAEKVLNEGLSEDMEVLALLGTIELNSMGTNRMWSIYEKMKAGEVGRKELQLVMKDIKKKEQERNKPSAPAKKSKEEKTLEAVNEKHQAKEQIQDVKLVKADDPDFLEEALARAWSDFGKAELSAYLKGGLQLGLAIQAWTSYEEKDLEFLVDLVEHWE
jgi:ParB/RepB/Spo0J family partition protein